MMRAIKELYHLLHLTTEDLDALGSGSAVFTKVSTSAWKVGFELK